MATEEKLSKEAKVFSMFLAGTPEEGYSIYRSFASNEAFAETAAFVMAAMVALGED